MPNTEERHKAFPMNYSIKDIYITILPGFLILLHIAVGHYGEDLLTMHFPEHISNLIFPSLLCILLGFINNAIGSWIEQKVNKYPQLPKDVKSHVEDWHQLKDSIELTPKIEEYYVHYVQARNMAVAFCISTIISAIYMLPSDRYCLILAIIIEAFISLFLFSVFKRHKKRYYEVLVAEYKKQKNINNN